MPKNLKYPKSEYTLEGFEKARAKGKKYTAIIRNKTTGRKKKINFGASDMEQYKDSTGLGLYSSKDHGDKKRRDNYRKRHKTYYSPDHYSPAFFSWKYLW